MINYEDENKRKLEKDDIRKIIISIVVSLIVTYVILSFIPFADMLDGFKVTFKTTASSKVVRNFVFTTSIIAIAIYTLLTYFIHKFVNYISIKKEN